MGEGQGWGGEGTVEARPRLIRAETTFLCNLRKLLIPCRQPCAEGSTRGPLSAPPSPGQGASAKAWSCSARLGHTLGRRKVGVRYIPGKTAPSSGMALKTGKNRQGGAHLCGDRGAPGVQWVPSSGRPLSCLCWAPPNPIQGGTQSLGEERTLANRVGRGGPRAVLAPS